MKSSILINHLLLKGTRRAPIFACVSWKFQFAFMAVQHRSLIAAAVGQGSDVGGVGWLENSLPEVAGVRCAGGFCGPLHGFSASQPGVAQSAPSTLLRSQSLMVR